MKIAEINFLNEKNKQKKKNMNVEGKIKTEEKLYQENPFIDEHKNHFAE